MEIARAAKARVYIPAHAKHEREFVKKTAARLGLLAHTRMSPVIGRTFASTRVFVKHVACGHSFPEENLCFPCHGRYSDSDDLMECPNRNCDWALMRGSECDTDRDRDNVYGWRRMTVTAANCVVVSHGFYKTHYTARELAYIRTHAQHNDAACALLTKEDDRSVRAFVAHL